MDIDKKIEFSSIMIDRNYNLVSFNDFAVITAEFTIGKKLKKGMSVLSLIEKENNESSIKIFKKAFEGEFIRKVFTNRMKTGEEAIVEYFYSPVFDSMNKVKYVLINAVNVTENHLLGKALEESEKRYKGIVNLQTSMLVRVNLEGKILFGNKAYFDTFSKKKTDILGKTFIPFVHPDDLDNVFEDMKKLEKPPHRITLEVRALTVNGWRWTQWEEIAIIGDDGKIKEIQAVGRDITDLKETLKSLTETNKFLESIFRASPLGIVVIDYENTVKFWSKGAEKIFQWSPEEAIGLFNPTIKESHKDVMKGIRERIFSGESVTDSNIERLRKDGTSVIVDLFAVPLTDSEGNVQAGLMIYQDVTLKVNAELENLKLNSALDLSNAAFAVISKSMMVESINKRFSELTEFENEEVEGKKLKDIIPPSITEKEYKEIVKNLKDGKVWKSERVNVSKTGKLYWENITVSPVAGNDGKISNYILIKEDISETKRAMQELVNTRLRLGTILNNFPDLVLYEFGGKNPFISANVEKILGYKPEDFLNYENFLESIILSIDLPAYLNKYNSWNISGMNDVLKMVFRCRRKDGQILWIENTVFKVSDESGSYYCGIIQDISEMKENEMRLIWNETLLRIMTDSTRFGFYVANKIEDTVLYVNEKFCELCGILDIYPLMQNKEITSSEVLRRIAQSVKGSEDFIAMSEKYNQPESRITFEDEIRLLNGRTLRRFSSTLLSEEGEYIGRFFLYEDITEKKLYDRIYATNDYKAIIEQSIDAVILFSIKGRIDSVNRNATELLGYNPYEFLTMHITDLIDEYEDDTDDKKLFDLTEGKTILSKRKLIRKDGSRVFTEMHTKMLPNRLVQAVIWEIEVSAFEDKNRVFDNLINPYVSLLHKLKAFRHGEDSMNCLNRISLFFKNYNYLFESEEMQTRNENEVIKRFLDIIDEYNSSVNPQIEYIVSLLIRLKDDIPKYSMTDNLLNSINELETNTKLLHSKLMKLSGYMKKRDHKEFSVIKTLEVMQAIAKIKLNFKIINNLFDGHFVADLDETVQKVIKYFSGIRENIMFSFSADAKHKIVFNNGELFDVIKIFIENSVEACEENSNKTIIIDMQTLQADDSMLLKIRDNGGGVADSVKKNIYVRGVSTKGTNRGFGLSYSNTLVQKYGGKFYIDTEYNEGAGFVLEFKIV